MSHPTVGTGTTLASKWSTVTNVPETKCITVFVNGDEFSHGTRCAICQKQIKYFTALLNHLTEKLKPQFGAVRTLYDIDSGKKASSLTELVHNQKYAAAGVEAFRRQEKWFLDPSQALNNGKRKPLLLNIKQQSSNASSTSKKKCHKPPLNELFWIYVYRNGDSKMAPVKCFLTNSERLFRSKVMQSINQLVYPSTGAAKSDKVSDGFRICSVTGQVMRIEDLIHGNTYVAVGNFETFRRRNYSAPLDIDKSVNKRADTGSSRRNFFMNKSWSSVEQQRNVAAVGSNCDNVFHAKEENSLARGAVEVEDTKETNVELPVEYWDPEEISVALSNNESLARGTVEVEDTKETNVELPVEYWDPEEITVALSSNESLARGAVEVEDTKETNVELPVEYWDPEEISEDLEKPTNLPQKMSSGELKKNPDKKPEFGHVKIPDSYQVHSSFTARIIDHDNVFHAKEENSLARGAVEVEDTKDTNIELPVEYWDPEEISEDLDNLTHSPQEMNSGEPKQNLDQKPEFGHPKIPDSYQVYSSPTTRIIGTEM